MKQIDGNRIVYDLVTEHPDLKEILVNIGLTPLSNDAMLLTVGRMMSLNDGIKQIDVSREELKKALSKANYQLKE